MACHLLFPFTPRFVKYKTPDQSPRIYSGLIAQVLCVVPILSIVSMSEVAEGSGKDVVWASGIVDTSGTATILQSDSAVLSPRGGGTAVVLGIEASVTDDELARAISSITQPVLAELDFTEGELSVSCLLYTSPSPRDGLLSRMPSSA